MGFKFGDILGEGRSGRVFQAVWRGQTVAVRICDLYQKPQYEEEVLTKAAVYNTLKSLQGYCVPRLRVAGYDGSMEVHRGKAFIFTPLGSEKCVFRGTYHAESMLGILAYLSHHTHPHPQTVPILPLFRCTYNTIGVSKRCCPVCTKLLTLLSPHRSQSHSTMQTGFTVLIGHWNIYSTALPPYVPGEVVEEMVGWLEGLLRGVVESAVRRYKRRRRGCVLSAGSGHSDEGGVVCRSEDSKGLSPVREGIEREKGGIEEEGGEEEEQEQEGEWE